MTPRVNVGPGRRAGGATRFDVHLGDRPYEVTVSDADAETLANGAPLEDLVRNSFAFLLEREPAESILGRFDLSVIERYFPGYRDEIRRRLGR